MIFVVLGMGLVFPKATAGGLSVYPENAGTASALLGFMQMSGAGLSVGVIGIITDGSHRPMTQALAGFGLLAAASFAMARFNRPKGRV
jgi:DHA1 family bicyclomycin/chloramphenicol resistance-like MFS transporter